MSSEDEIGYDAVEVIEDPPTTARPATSWGPLDELTNPSVEPTIDRGEEPHLVAGRYQLLDLLSSGGMGQVYRARHRDLGRIFALKLVLEGLSTDQKIRE